MLSSVAQLSGDCQTQRMMQNTTSKTHLILIAFLTGGLLTIMTLFNGRVALGGGAIFSSWVAHGVGTVAAIIALIVLFRRRPKGGTRSRAPFWAYLGGISGALTVILTSTTVNTSLALSGTIALGLAGQMVFGLGADVLGLFGLPKRRLAPRELVSFAMICAGSLIIIYLGRV